MSVLVVVLRGLTVAERRAVQDFLLGIVAGNEKAEVEFMTDETKAKNKRI